MSGMNEPIKSQVYKNYRFNFIVNALDGGFFGSAIGFASFITVIPLFVSTMTDSAILIGLIPAIHSMGWQLPQLFTARKVSSLRRYKPMVMWMSIHERLPFVGLAIVAWILPSVGVKVALILTFIFLIWQGMGGGVTATAWQSLIGKIIPGDRLGTFFGIQSASANLLSSGAAILAGLMLERLTFPLNYTLCFMFAGIGMLISYGFLGMTREQESPPEKVDQNPEPILRKTAAILRRDSNLRWFLVVRMLSQLAVMAFAFYTVYAVRNLGMTEGVAGLMMGIYTVGQIVANPLMGWIGDRWSHAAVMKVGLASAGLSALVAGFAPSVQWFFLVFVLAGVANVAIWTIGIAMTMELSLEAERPVYIGIANTMIAPATILAPVLGGWLADNSGFQTTFFVSAVSGLVTVLVLHLLFQDPRRVVRQDTKPFCGD